MWSVTISVLRDQFLGSMNINLRLPHWYSTTLVVQVATAALCMVFWFLLLVLLFSLDLPLLLFQMVYEDVVVLG